MNLREAFTQALVDSNRHYSTGTIEGPLLTAVYAVYTRYNIGVQIESISRLSRLNIRYGVSLDSITIDVNTESSITVDVLEGIHRLTCLVSSALINIHTRSHNMRSWYYDKL